jgi:putative salt-induced outer membrane protein YdiY
LQIAGWQIIIGVGFSINSADKRTLRRLEMPAQIVRTRFRAVVATIILGSLMLTAPASYAGQIFMKNGDVITADIKKIWDEDVTIEPAYADEFTIDLDAIDHFESDREFDIELADGRESKAMLIDGGGGTQVLRIDGTTLEVPVMQLAELDEPEDDFDWDSNLDLNSVVNTGNTDNVSATLQFKTNLKTGDHRHIGGFLFTREEQNGETVKEQDRADYSYNWSFRDPWFLGLNIAAERDPVRDLNYRATLGGGIGYNFWDDASRFFQLQAIAGHLTEDFDSEDIDGLESNDSAIAGWIVRFRYRLIKDLTIFHDHTATTNVSGRSNNVFQSQTGVRYEITDLLYANFQFDFDYESAPSAGNKSTDTTTLLGLGLEF